ncbi:DUF1488 domain-containing protein [Vibrio sp. TRT 21S02]|uniref:DUF1488 domain-containing protein n=1 Tax=unclassified Vibrio TaxID=2614977 RepID=UPI003CE8A528
MNQSILFPDIQSWDAELRTIRFPAQYSGALIECILTSAELEKIAGTKIEGEQQALEIFNQNRFEIEELAETLIEEEVFTPEGVIEVVS